MLRHIVAWNYKDGFTDAENKENAQKVKMELEGLKNHIPEIMEIKVNIEMLPTSNRDIVLDSLFKDEAALAAYQVHPEHQRAAAFVASVTQNRVCVDYYE
ncbi:MAG: Dabb family protein [Defluviitaleaceae bacterium]|nr:Dabb family protein [Defluviitaleaceae bacterium]